MPVLGSALGGHMTCQLCFGQEVVVSQYNLVVRKTIKKCLFQAISDLAICV